jgi:hypothetical protein
MGRPLAALLVLCVAVPAIALAADTDPKKRFTAADRTKARSIVLKRTDFAAGWKLTPPSPESDLVCPGFNPDESDLTLTGEGEANFDRAADGAVVYSYSEVWASKADALKSWARSDKPAVARCLGYAFRKGAEEEEGVQVKIVSAGRMAFPKLAPRTAAFKVVARVTFTDNGQTQTVPFTIQAFAFGNGRADATFAAITAGAGLAPADLRAFGTLLAKRLAAAKL